MENKTQGRQNNDPRTQKFYFSEEGELIVESNRGIYVDGKQYVKMYGNFTCNAKVMGEIINKLRSIPVEVGIEEKVRMSSDAVVDDILGVHEHTIQHYCVLGASEERISEYEHTCAEQRYTNSEIERLKIRLENMNVHAENLKKEKESLFITYNKAIAAYNALPWWKRIFKHVEI